MESEYQHSSGLHTKPPVFYTQHAYTIFGEKYSRPFLCSPCPAQNDNPKSRSLFALKSQIAEFKEAKLTMPKNVLGHYRKFGVCLPPESRRDYQAFTVPFPSVNVALKFNRKCCKWSDPPYFNLADRYLTYSSFLW